ncbi:IclR family transcriptional regulator, partial [Halarchaeum acidiphilum]
MERDRPESVQASRTTLRVLDALRELDGAGVTELSRALDMPKSTVHRHLTALEQEQFVTRDGDDYVVGLHLFQLGEYARKRKAVYCLAVPHTEEIAKETGERSQFVVEEYGRGIYLHVAAGEHAVHTGFETGGEIQNLHSTAAGKLFLAHMPTERRNRLLDEQDFP